ncbi:MAG: hypothetical protein IPK68_04105 [Bdellovibrionales bacterium]|nr:hypothetical protein [Bdellovibrionales bacterium]
MKKNRKAKEENTALISFKIAPEVFSKIKKYAKTQKDEAGLVLSASLAARRLMLKALTEIDD